MEDRYRITIDVKRIQSNLLRYEGGRLSELQIRNWLRSVGFEPENDVQSVWLADADCLGRLHETEIVDLTRLGASA